MGKGSTSFFYVEEDKLSIIACKQTNSITMFHFGLAAHIHRPVKYKCVTIYNDWLVVYWLAVVATSRVTIMEYNLIGERSWDAIHYFLKCRTLEDCDSILVVVADAKRVNTSNAGLTTQLYEALPVSILWNSRISYNTTHVILLCWIKSLQDDTRLS